MIPVVKTRIEPQNIHALWIDEKENSIKIFGPNGWQSIGTVSSDLTDEDIKKLEEALKNIEDLTTSKTNDVDTIQEALNLLKGFKESDNLKQYITNLINQIDVEAISDAELDEILV